MITVKNYRKKQKSVFLTYLSNTMAQIFTASIDVSKISKSKIKEITLKNGNKAKFLQVSIVVNDEIDQFGNILSISEGQSQEERTAKTPKNFLGNGKLTWSSDSKPNSGLPGNQTPVGTNEDDLPF